LQNLQIMSFYRNKPEVVRAVRISIENWDEVYQVVTKDCFKSQIWVHPNVDHIFSKSPLPEFPTKDQRIGLIFSANATNTHSIAAIEGEWIVKDSSGDLCSYLNQDFIKLYESI